MGIPGGIYYQSLDPQVKDAVNEALSLLDRLTAAVQAVELGEPPNFPFSVSNLAERYTFHQPYVESVPELYHPQTLQGILRGADTRAPDYIRDWRERLRRTIDERFEVVDLLITPTVPVPPMTIEEALKTPPGAVILRNTIPFNS